MDPVILGFNMEKLGAPQAQHENMRSSRGVGPSSKVMGTDSICAEPSAGPLHTMYCLRSRSRKTGHDRLPCKVNLLTPQFHRDSQLRSPGAPRLHFTRLLASTALPFSPKRRFLLNPSRRRAPENSFTHTLLPTILSALTYLFERDIWRHHGSLTQP
jgi:hypothetical protein